MLTKIGVSRIFPGKRTIIEKIFCQETFGDIGPPLYKILIEIKYEKKYYLGYHISLTGIPCERKNRVFKTIK
jgi:hypothetical protein